MSCTSTQFPYRKTTTFSYNTLSLFCPHKQLWLSQSVTFASFNTLRIPPHCPTNYPSANAQVLCSAPTSLPTALALCSCFTSLKAGYGSIPVFLSIMYSNMLNSTISSTKNAIFFVYISSNNQHIWTQFTSLIFTTLSQYP